MIARENLETATADWGDVLRYLFCRPPHIGLDKNDLDDLFLGF
jgi:hypothetical protein